MSGKKNKKGVMPCTLNPEPLNPNYCLLTTGFFSAPYMFFSGRGFSSHLEPGRLDH
jgi:hypothetical protein